MSSRGDIEYSPGALDTLPLFHRKRFVVFVEGGDDIVFWRQTFRLCGAHDAHFKVGGGKSTLARYMAAAVSGADIVVALDSDWSEADGTRVDHPRVLYTFGYSIENTLCSCCAVAAILEIYLPGAVDHDLRASEWKARLERDVMQLVILDLANHLSGAGDLVPLDKPFRLLDKHQRDRVSLTEVEKLCVGRCDTVNRAVPEAETYLAKSEKGTWARIRGHFLTAALLHFVCHVAFTVQGRRLSLSHDAVFGLLISKLDTCITGEERNFYCTSIARMARG